MIRHTSPERSPFYCLVRSEPELSESCALRSLFHCSYAGAAVRASVMAWTTAQAVAKCHPCYSWSDA